MPGPKGTRIGETRIGEHSAERSRVDRKVLPFMRPPVPEAARAVAPLETRGEAVDSFIAIGERGITGAEIGVANVAPVHPSPSVDSIQGRGALRQISHMTRTVALMPAFFLAAMSGPEALAAWRRAVRGEEGPISPESDRPHWQEDLAMLHMDRFSFVGKIEGLTAELESTFERGGRVIKVMDRYYLVGADQPARRPIGSVEMEAYQSWKKEQGFAEGNFESAQTAWAELQSRARARGVVISYERKGTVQQPEVLEPYTHAELGRISEQISYLNELLGLLPEGYFKESKLKEIRLVLDPSQRQYGDRTSTHKNGVLRLGMDQWMGSRRNLIGWFFNGIGRVAVEKFKDDPKMQAAYRLIKDERALWGLDWQRGEHGRRDVQKSSFEEFLAEFVLSYVSSGAELRAHVKHSKTKAAWDYLYKQVSEELFQKKEYDFDVEPGSSYAIPREAQTQAVPEVNRHLEFSGEVRGGALARWNFPDLLPSMGLVGEVIKVEGDRVVLRDARRKVNGVDQEIPGRVVIEGADLRYGRGLQVYDRVHWLPGAEGRTAMPPRAPETNLGPSRDELNSKVFAVHATGYLPANGLIKVQAKNIPYFRPTLHWSLGGLVEAHGGGNWEAMPFAVVTPLGSLKKQWVNLSAEDSFTLGNIQIPSDAILLVPKGTDISALRGKVRVQEYDGSLRDAVKNTIEAKKGWILESRRREVFREPELFVGEKRVEPLDFFQALLNDNPQISYGVHMTSQKGEAFRFGVIDQILMDTIKSYREAPGLNTAELRVRRHLLADQLMKLESSVEAAPLASEAKQSFKEAKEATEQWINIIDADLEIRKSSGKTLSSADESILFKAFSLKRKVGPLRESLRENLSELPVVSETRGLQTQKLANAMTSFNPKEFLKFLAETRSWLKPEEQAELKFHYVMRRWMLVKAEAGRMEGLPHMLEEGLRGMGENSGSEKAFVQFLKKYAASDAFAQETATTILSDPYVQKYLKERGVTSEMILTPY